MEEDREKLIKSEKWGEDVKDVIERREGQREGKKDREG